MNANDCAVVGADSGGNGVPRGGDEIVRGVADGPDACLTFL